MSVNFYNIFRLETFVGLSNGKLDRFPLFQATEPFSLDGAKMDKNICFPIWPLQKSIPFARIKPFNLSLNTF